MVVVGMVVNLDVEAIAYWMLCAYWMLIGACNPMGWPIHVYRHVTAMGMFELCGYRQARSNTPPHTHTHPALTFFWCLIPRSSLSPLLRCEPGPLLSPLYNTFRNQPLGTAFSRPLPNQPEAKKQRNTETRK